MNGRPALPFEHIRPVVSHGGRALIELGFGLEPEHPDFETFRKQLLDYYLTELDRQGVDRVPDFEEAWHDHRLASIWGLVIGWLITPPVNYGEEITAANIERTTAAVIDLDAFSFRSQNPLLDHHSIWSKPS